MHKSLLLLTIALSTYFIGLSTPAFSAEKTAAEIAKEKKIKAKRITKKLTKIDSKIESVDVEILATSRRMNTLATEIKDLNDQEHLIRQRIQAGADAKSETARTITRIERMPLTAMILSDSLRGAHIREGIVKSGRASLNAEMSSLRTDIAELNTVMNTRAELLLELQEESNEQVKLKKKLSKSYTKQLKALQLNDKQKAKMLARAHDMKQAATLDEMMRLQKVMDETLMPKARDTGIKIPLPGAIVEAYGEKNELGVSSHGIRLSVTPSSSVLALKDGRVVFNDTFSSYGHVVILEHADGANSLYSGLKSSHVNVGDAMHAGKSIGTMPNSEKPELYIEIRKNDTPINPQKWL